MKEQWDSGNMRGWDEQGSRHKGPTHVLVEWGRVVSA